mmetsp:Transcript_3136/g.8915  ORF Transcript_3136/g.8915 Transcript_3136/m.8915 type:complete len:286 (-) Transcript_3136:243-1100(-)
MILENLTHGFNKPCVMDLKLGTRTAEGSAGAFKQIKMLARDEMSGTTTSGVQLIALAISRPKDQMQYKATKANGYILTMTTPMEQILGFFLGDGKRVSKRLIWGFKEKVEVLLDAFKKQRTYQFIGSSLLFVYDGQPDSNTKLRCEVRMIDFAHVIEPEEAKEIGDPYYVTGLETILRALDSLYRATHLQQTGREHMLAAQIAAQWRHKAAKGRSVKYAVPSPEVAQSSLKSSSGAEEGALHDDADSDDGTQSMCADQEYVLFRFKSDMGSLSAECGEVLRSLTI